MDSHNSNDEKISVKEDSAQETYVCVLVPKSCCRLWHYGVGAKTGSARGGKLGSLRGPRRGWSSRFSGLRART